MWHLCDAWERWDQPNVELVHYADLPANLGGEMRRLAELLGFTVPDDRWEALVEAATFKSMKALAEQLAPDPKGVLKSRARGFRQGGSGEGASALSGVDLARYEGRVADLAPSDLAAWLHR